MRAILVFLAAAAFLGVATNAMELMAVYVGDNWMDEVAYGIRGYDFDNDGLPEICYEEPDVATPVIYVRELDGTLLWSYVLPKAQVCPTCGPNWTYSLSFFANVAEPAGKEAIVSWDNDQYGSGPSGYTVVSTSSSVVFRNFPDASCDGAVDFNGDGTEELILEFEDSRHEIWGYTPSGSVESGGDAVPGGDMSLLPSRPNPASNRSAVALELSAPSAVDLRIVDVGGRLVRDLSRRQLPAGRHEIEWDGLDGMGHAVAAGVYYLEAEASGECRASRIMIAK